MNRFEMNRFEKWAWKPARSYREIIQGRMQARVHPLRTGRDVPCRGDAEALAKALPQCRQRTVAVRKRRHPVDWPLDCGPPVAAMRLKTRAGGVRPRQIIARTALHPPFLFQHGRQSARPRQQNCRANWIGGGNFARPQINQRWRARRDSNS